MSVINRSGLKSWDMEKSGLEVKKDSRVKRKGGCQGERIGKSISRAFILL